VAEKYKTDQLV